MLGAPCGKFKIAVIRERFWNSVHILDALDYRAQRRFWTKFMAFTSAFSCEKCSTQIEVNQSVHQEICHLFVIEVFQFLHDSPHSACFPLCIFSVSVCHNKLIVFPLKNTNASKHIKKNCFILFSCWRLQMCVCLFGFSPLFGPFSMTVRRLLSVQVNTAVRRAARGQNL